MPLATQIRELADRVQDNLRAARDFYYHTESAWRVVQQVAAEGRKVNVRNMETGAILGIADLEGLAKRYVSLYLAESVFQHFVSLFEDFVFGLLGSWLVAYPAGIPNKDRKPVDLATIIDAPDKEAIIRAVVDRELDGLKYERPAAWFKYLNDRVKLGCPTSDQTERLAEIKASRDILVHNRGIVNKSYLDKAGTGARFTVGQRLEISEPYLLASWTLIRDVVQDMAAAAIAKAPTA
jgi:hypothetical protein